MHEHVSPQAAPPRARIAVVAGAHPLIGPDFRFQVSRGGRICQVRSSTNPFESAAAVSGPGAVSIVLTGTRRDAADGACAIHAHGGTVLVQDPSRAAFPSMPAAAIAPCAASSVLPLPRIAAAMVSLARPGPSGGRTPLTPAATPLRTTR